MKREKFKESDIVDWKDDSIREWFKDKQGDGPFIVMLVKKVPRKLIKAVGHHQWILIGKDSKEPKEGILLFNRKSKKWGIDFYPQTEISGAYFKKINKS